MSRFICAVLLVMSCVTNAREIQLTRANTFVLDEEIYTLGLFMDVENIITMSESTKEPVYVLLYSPGGELEPVLKTAAALSRLKNVHAVVLKAASGAAAISQILPGKRYMVAHGELLFHKVRISGSGILTLDTIQELYINMAESERHFARWCYSRLKITPGRYNKNVTNRDWALDANEAIKVGAIDEIVTVRCAADLEQANIIVTTYSPFLGMPRNTNICNLLTEK